MRDAVVCEPIRTPVGGFGGSLRDVPAVDLAAIVIRELMARTAIPPEAVDDVALGQGYANGEAPGIGRVAALDAGLPVSTAGLQLDRRCGSGLQAITCHLIELNEAFAAQVLACTAEWGVEDDDEHLNVHGSGISLGHPIGATGGRILATLLREMVCRDATFGLETMCIGGGQGIAAVFERVG